MLKFPIAAFHKNIIFTTSGRAFAMYRIPPRLWRFFSLERKTCTVEFLNEILAGFTGRGQMLLLWQELAIDEGGYLKGCLGGRPVDPRCREESIRHARSSRATMARGARIRRRFILFELSLKKQISDLQDCLMVARDTALKTLLSIRPMQIPDTIKEVADNAEQELYLNVRQSGFSRTSFNDLDFMIRKVADRIGVLPPPLPEREGGVLTPAAVAAFTDGAVLEEKLDHITVNNGNGDTHLQSFVFFVDKPQQLPPFGKNIFDPSELSFPFDVSIHFEVIPAHTAESKVDSKKRMLKGQMVEALTADESLDSDEEDGIQGSKKLKKKLKQGKPLGRFAVCLGIATKDLKELRSRGDRICQHFRPKHFRAVRPAAKQIEAIYSFLPGSEPAAPTVECDTGFIAATGPHFASEIGDPQGFFLGWSGQIPVLWKPGRPALELDKTNAIVITGSLGGGKTFLAIYLAYLVLLSGGYVMATDPKGDFFPFKDLFGDLVRIIDLSPRSGISFSPFVLAKQDIKAKSIALNYLTLSLNAVGNEARRLAISQALGLLYQKPVHDRHMGMFRQDLHWVSQNAPHNKVREEAEQCMFLLTTIEETDVGRIVFGESSGVFFEQGERMIILHTKEIPRPQPKTPPNEYTEDERQGFALINLLDSISREVAFGLPKSMIKLKITDEAWAILSVSTGERLLKEEIRIGRSFNLIPVLISQNMTDINKSDILNNVSQIFCFRAESASEVEANLEALGADPGSVKPETFAELKSGRCLYKDAEGRVGWLDVEMNPPYLEKEFDTKPNAEKQLVKEKGGGS